MRIEAIIITGRFDCQNTPGALAALERPQQAPASLLARHATGVTGANWSQAMWQRMSTALQNESRPIPLTMYMPAKTPYLKGWTRLLPQK